MSKRPNTPEQPSGKREQKALIVALAIVIAIIAAYFVFDLGFRTAPETDNNGSMRAVEPEQMQPEG